MFKNKYLKYKNKYINLKNQIGGYDNCLYLDDTLTNEKIIKFKQKLDNRTSNNLKNWLVIYAGYDKLLEQIRFKNPHWIFWNLDTAIRTSIQGSFNEDNLIKLHKILSNTFDYICFDDDVTAYYNGLKYTDADGKIKKDLILRLVEMLKPGGFLVIKNIINIGAISEDEVSITRFLSKKSKSTPHGIGYNNHTLLDKIFNILQYIKFQKIKSINLSEYDYISQLIKYGEKSIDEILACHDSLKYIIKDPSLKINPNFSHCEKFLIKYQDINIHFEMYKQNLEKEYKELLGKVTEFWSLPNFSDSIEDSITSELFIIKKN